MYLSIPILDRLSFRDFQNIVFTVIFFIFESFIRIIVTVLPQFVIDLIDAFIAAYFPWLSKLDKKPHVCSLENAQTFDKLIEFWDKNYQCEQHLVKSKDEYLLCVHRVICTKSNKNMNQNKPIIANQQGINVLDCLDHFPPRIHDDKTDTRPVVLLFHGFLMSSEIWACNIDEYRNLPLLLATRGYDVWLGNARGNKYSQAHLKLSANDVQFWNFSLNELAMYDLPDIIDYILKLTGRKDLTYIGFSQGTALGFSSLSVNQDLNRKVNLFIALAPATTPIGLHHPLIDAFVKAAPSVVYLIFGRKMPLELAMFWQRMVSPPLYVRIIDTCVKFLFGWQGNNITPEQKLVSYQHLYSPTSVKTLVHWFQIIRTGQFQMFDEMPSRLPFKRQSSVTDHVPPRFPTKQITTPMALFYGGSDLLVNFKVLSRDLPRPLAYIKSIDSWEHLDFIWAAGIEDIVFPDIIRLIDHFNPISKKHHQNGRYGP
ncbi:Alpha/Beta hydrolase protein [Halteromyces radiatus]|uniref:Alpha/Beta hydrolase protein n=1 Tax=Halteromyces radiatus TaxID=101107 RepID=UPI00221EEC2C|nr:Alpha/Beta hydrolase protein [Halteromyces radiatus]KAI8096736.1 Alpha/Beta hydrolase protein [Halteromyces radiatus]